LQPITEKKPGAKAFELYDTLVSIDLTVLRERGFSLDEAFDKAMLEQKTRSRAALKFQRMTGRF
jgi:alanyl-tRNA synthetase